MRIRDANKPFIVTNEYQVIDPDGLVAEVSSLIRAKEIALALNQHNALVDALAVAVGYIEASHHQSAGGIKTVTCGAFTFDVAAARELIK